MIWQKQADQRSGCLISDVVVLISRHYVLTAAHCVVNKFFPHINDFVRNTVVKAGKQRINGREPFEQIRSIDQIHVHPLYDAHTCDNDVSLLRLSRGINLNAATRDHMSLLRLER